MICMILISIWHVQTVLPAARDGPFHFLARHMGLVRVTLPLNLENLGTHNFRDCYFLLGSMLTDENLDLKCTKNH